MDTLHWSVGIRVTSIKELCETLEWKFTEQENEIQRIKDENTKLKSEHYKDKELQKLKEENLKLKKQLTYGFGISEKERESINKFMNTHDCSHKGMKIKGISEYRFRIIPGIGYNAYVKCSCGKEFCFYKE